MGEQIPTLTGELARAVIDPVSYAAWDSLLDTFDHIRATTPVVKVMPDVLIILAPMLFILLLVILFPDIALWLPMTLMPDSFN